MLYDEAIKQMSAVAALFDEDFKKEPARIEKANTHILKSQEIITELMASLDMDNGGEIARNLLALYTWFNQQLLEANMEKKADKILAVKNLMDQLRGAWIEVVSTTSAPQSRQNAPAGINIAG
jgi:flagellar protein FliS